MHLVAPEVPGRITKNSNIWVVPDEDAVATRFLFVYRGTRPCTQRATRPGENTLAPAFDREVRARVDALKSARRPVTPAPRTEPPPPPELPPAKAQRTKVPRARRRSGWARPGCLAS